jgi:hypothetical protein
MKKMSLFSSDFRKETTALAEKKSKSKKNEGKIEKKRIFDFLDQNTVNR